MAWAAYQRLLHAHPLRTKMVFSATTWGVMDYFTQRGEHAFIDSGDGSGDGSGGFTWNASRSLRQMVWGCLAQAPATHFVCGARVFAAPPVEGSRESKLRGVEQRVWGPYKDLDSESHLGCELKLGQMNRDVFMRTDSRRRD